MHTTTALPEQLDLFAAICQQSDQDYSDQWLETATETLMIEAARIAQSKLRKALLPLSHAFIRRQADRNARLTVKEEEALGYVLGFSSVPLRFESLAHACQLDPEVIESFIWDAFPAEATQLMRMRTSKQHEH